MTLDPDREWDQLASSYRRYKRFMPMSVEEAERVFEEAPEADISSDDIRRLVASAISTDSVVPQSSSLPNSIAGTGGADATFSPNARVRLKGDPTRIGIITGNTRPGR